MKILIYIGVWVLLTAWFIYTYRKAPMGWQDSKGFHKGVPEDDEETTS